MSKHQRARFEVSERFIEIFTVHKTFVSILSDEKYLIFEVAWKLGIEVQDCQCTLVVAADGMPSFH